MIITMKIGFVFRLKDDKNFWFGSTNNSTDSNYDLLCYIFSAKVLLDNDNQVKSNSSHFWFNELLEEIDQIEQGKLERNEETGLVDLGDPGDLIIYKNKTTLELRSDGKYLEITTHEFKTLVQLWIKFISVNVEGFKQDMKPL